MRQRVATAAANIDPVIGVAISTWRRPDTLALALNEWARRLAGVSLLVVNHDEQGRGVAETKNAGLAALMADPRITDLFLADDDVSPIADDWARPYVQSPHPHLMHCWGANRYEREIDGHTIWSWPRGVLLYARRAVVERVGGMRPDFGPVGGEHVEWSRRVHNCGFTPHPFMDVAGSNRLWCYDTTAPTTLPKTRYTDRRWKTRRQRLLESYRHSTEHVALPLPAHQLTSPL